MNKLAHMFKMQSELQRHTYGIPVGELDPEDRAQFVMVMHTAIVDELSEVLKEVGWKPWAKSRHFNREEYVGEMVDVFHFFMNLFLVAGTDPEELADELFTRYCIKNRINVQRQEDGYDGVTTKCSECNSAFDDPAVRCYRRGDHTFCNVLGRDINLI